MRSRRARRAGQVILVLALAGGFAGGGAAQADAPIVQGWWATTSPGDALPITPPALPVPVPPDVPPGGLLVQGGASEDSPTAYAALAYDLDTGMTADRLVLTVAPNSATNPQAGLKICALKDSSFAPEQGGPMADAPAYDCARSATASPSADGTTYRFDAGKVADGTTLAIAVLPTTATDRVVLAKPAGSSLTTKAGAGGSSAPPAFDPNQAPAAPAGGTGSADGPALQPGSSVAAPPAMGSADVPGPAVASAVPDAVVASPQQQPAAISPVPLASDGTSHSTRTAIMLIGALALAAVLWSIAGGSATARA